MLKRYFYILTAVLFLFVSCHRTSYRYTPISSKHGIYFHGNDKWLFVSKSAPGGFAMEASSFAFSELQKKIGDRLTHVADTRGLMHIHNLSLQPDRKTLEDLKTGTGFDFIIHFRFSQRSADVSDIYIGKPYRNLENEVLTVLEIYDLNNFEIIQVQELVGRLSLKEDDREFVVNESSEKIAKRSVKKILKKILP